MRGTLRYSQIIVTKINDLNGIGWTVISTKYVAGTVLEDLDNPAPYYETIGQWVFHDPISVSIVKLFHSIEVPLFCLPAFRTYGILSRLC